MIILKDECKKRDLTVGEFLASCPVPAQTLRDWCKSKPDLVLYLLRVPVLEALALELEHIKNCKAKKIEENNQALEDKQNDILITKVIESITDGRVFSCLRNRSISINKDLTFDYRTLDDLFDVLNFFLPDYPSSLSRTDLVELIKVDLALL